MPICIMMYVRFALEPNHADLYGRVIYDPLRFGRIFLVEGLWIDRRITNVQVPRPNGFFSRTFRKIKFLGINFNY